jgi:hypothetical protein
MITLFLGVGVGVGVLLLLALIGFIVLCTVLAKKRKAKSDRKLYGSPQTQAPPLQSTSNHRGNNDSYDYPETQQTQNHGHSPQISQSQHGSGGRLMQGSNHQEARAAPAVTQYSR